MERDLIEGEEPRERPDRRFRLDIEGMRAVAVTLVLLYHAGVTRLPGGFVGVDVFFVISGFLITSHLVNELRDTGTIRLGNFYARRAKRLLPASALLLVVVGLLTVVFLPATRWASTGADILASAFYVMNWRLAVQSVDYLGGGAAASPVQHFWSLAVEEQYYLIWPLLLIAATFLLRPRSRWRGSSFFRRRRTALDGRRFEWALVAAFCLVALPSFAWSVHYTVTDPGPAYFATTTRLWELALGAVVAILARHLHRIPTAVAASVGWLALAALLVTAVRLTTAVPFPGWVAMVPVLATGAIIACGPAAGRVGPGVLLSLRPLVWLGAISYSVYLWHWPMVVVARTLLPNLNQWQGLAVVAASVLPAWASTKLVENPIRFSRRFASLATTAKVGVAATLVVAWVGVGVQLAAGPPPPPPSPIALTAPAADEEAQGAELLATDPAVGIAVDDPGEFTPSPKAAGNDLQLCLADADVVKPKPCIYGDRSSSQVMVLVGDSHAGQWIPPLARIASDRGWKLVTYIKQLCPYAAVVEPAEGGGAPYEACTSWNEAVQQEIAAMSTAPVLFATSNIQRNVLSGGQLLTGRKAAAALTEGLRARWAPLIDQGVPVLALGDTPWPDIDVPDCVSGNEGQLTRCAVSREDGSSRSSSALSDAAEGLPGATFLNLFDAVCPADPCAPVIGGVLVYADTNHMTATYAQTLRSRIAPTVEQLVPAESGTP